MGKRITLKMTQKKNRRTKRRLEEAEPNAAQELHGDGGLNIQDGVGNAQGNDEVNVPAEIGREDDEQDGNQEKAVVDDEPKGTEDLDLGDSKDDKPNDGLSEDGNQIGSTMEPLPKSSNEEENAPQTQADDEPKDTEDLDPPNAEELRKRKGKGIYHSDSDDDKSKDDKPDDNLSDDEAFKEHKEEIYGLLNRPPELIHGFDAGIPIETQNLPARSDENPLYSEVELELEIQRAKRESLIDNLYYTDEEYELLTQQAKHQSLLDLEKPRTSSQSGSGTSSSATEGPSGSEDPPVEYFPPQGEGEMPGIQTGPSSSDDEPVEHCSPQRKREMPSSQSGLTSFDDQTVVPRKTRTLRWIRCTVCGFMKPPDRMDRVSCKCQQYAICLDYCILKLGVGEAQLNTRLVCPVCSENFFHVELLELFTEVLFKLLLLKIDSPFRN